MARDRLTLARNDNVRAPLLRLAGHPAEGALTRMAPVGHLPLVGPVPLEPRVINGTEVDVRLPRWPAACKRMIDLAVGGAALVVTAPVVAAAAVAIRVDSRGHWLFRQTRLGRDGQPFRMLKLRTMEERNDDRAHKEYVAALIRGEGVSIDGLFKLVDDPRCTRVGRFLRRYSLDELPQLWNVVRGDMSLVGPRPPLPEEVTHYGSRARARFALKPGLTGLPQVMGRSRLTFQESVELDLRYAAGWSPRLELAILARTPWVVLCSKDTA